MKIAAVIWLINEFQYVWRNNINRKKNLKSYKISRLAQVN